MNDQLPYESMHDLHVDSAASLATSQKPDPPAVLSTAVLVLHRDSTNHAHTDSRRKNVSSRTPGGVCVHQHHRLDIYTEAVHVASAHAHLPFRRSHPHLDSGGTMWLVALQVSLCSPTDPKHCSPCNVFVTEPRWKTTASWRWKMHSRTGHQSVASVDPPLLISAHGTGIVRGDLSDQDLSGLVRPGLGRD